MAHDPAPTPDENATPHVAGPPHAPGPAGLARQDGHVAVPRHRDHVLHRADRVVHRPAGRLASHRVQQLHPPGRHQRRLARQRQGGLDRRAGQERQGSRRDLREVLRLPHGHGRGGKRLSPPPGRARPRRQGDHRRDEARRRRLVEVAARRRRREDRDPAAPDHQLAAALRQVEQPALDRPDRAQHLLPHLLVGHHGPGALGRAEGQSDADWSSTSSPRCSSGRSSWGSRRSSIRN